MSNAKVILYLLVIFHATDSLKNGEVHYEFKYYNPDEVVDEHHIYVEKELEAVETSPTKGGECGDATSSVTVTMTSVITNSNLAKHTELEVSTVTSTITTTELVTSDVHIKSVFTRTADPETEVVTVYLTDTKYWTEDQLFTQPHPVTVDTATTATEVDATTEVVIATTKQPEFTTQISTVVYSTTTQTTEVVSYVSTMTLTSTFHDIIQVVKTDTKLINVVHTVWQTSKESMMLYEKATSTEVVTVTNCPVKFFHGVLDVFG